MHNSDNPDINNYYKPSEFADTDFCPDENVVDRRSYDNGMYGRYFDKPPKLQTTGVSATSDPCCCGEGDDFYAKKVMKSLEEFNAQKMGVPIKLMKEIEEVLHVSRINLLGLIRLEEAVEQDLTEYDRKQTLWISTLHEDLKNIETILDKVWEYAHFPLTAASISG